MNDDPIRRFLRARGVADHVVEGGLDGLVTSWEQVAAHIEQGYDLTLDDYLNDLDTRQILEVVLAAMPEPDGPLLDRMRAADDRVRAATVPVRQCVWGEGASPGWSSRRNWWYFVIPVRPGEELADDIAQKGFSGPA
jgi:hypothetical protein